MRPISLSSDILDSRDIDERIKYLESDFENTPEDERDPAEVEELATWIRFRDECDLSEWKYGATFIAEDYFEEYARDLAEDIGAISRDAQWPNDCIDWERAASQLKMDYSCFEIDGYTFWHRD